MAKLSEDEIDFAGIHLRPEGEGTLRVNPGATFQLRLEVANESGKLIDWTNDKQLNLAYRWRGDAGEFVETDGHRSTLARPLAAGRCVSVQLMGVGPATNGPHDLIVSLVQENVGWACDVASDGWIALPALVEDRPIWPNKLLDSPGGKALRGALAAHALKREFAARPLDLSASHELAPAVLDRPEPATASTSEVVRPQKPTLKRRLRAWFRHYLGIPELREAVEALLTRASIHQDDITALHAQVDDLSEVVANTRILGTAIDSLSAQIQALDTRTRAIENCVDDILATIEARANAIERHAEDIAGVVHSRADDITGRVNDSARLIGQLAARGDSDQKALNAQLKKQEKSFLDLRDKVRVMSSSVGRSLSIVGELAKLSSSQSGILKKINTSTISSEKSQRRSADGLTRLESALKDDIRARNTVSKEIANVARSVEGTLSSSAEINKKIEAQKLVLANQLKTSEAIADELKIVAEQGAHLITRTETVGEASQINLVELRTYGEKILHGIHHGAVAVEMISATRQIGEMLEGLQESIRAVETISLDGITDEIRALSKVTDESLRHLESTSGKLDALLSREMIALPSAGLVLARTEIGFLAVNDDDPAAIAFYSSGALPEPGTMKVIENLLNEGDLFLDVGANVGGHTLMAARQVGSTGRVLSVEPMPSTLHALRTTIAMNGMTERVTVHECALGAEAKRAILYRGMTSGHNSFIRRPDGFSEGVEVAVKKGSTILRNRRPALIKIDVEGWETEVIRGLGPVASHAAVNLIIEFAPDHIRSKNMSVQDWFGIIAGLGKPVFRIDDQSFRLERVRSAETLGDMAGNLLVSAKPPKVGGGDTR